MLNLDISIFELSTKVVKEIQYLPMIHLFENTFVTNEPAIKNILLLPNKHNEPKMFNSKAKTMDTNKIPVQNGT